MNHLYCTPIYCRCAGPHLFVYTVAESHLLRKRQAIRECQTNLYTRNPILRPGIGGGCLPRRIFVYGCPGGLDTTACQEASYLVHNLLEGFSMLWFGALR